eukprot:TRINITY_DN1159_c0_g1_i1.p1 TRINITY_DN1159_c0_g1~~TRINITY_DN1159_c0_g1_i1.p1  ORF type:complete len:158 (-),score=65.57 TRINITY_DN1159_c0_g1_i1:67-495(-)
MGLVTEAMTMKVSSLFSMLLLAASSSLSRGGIVLEIQAKTSTVADAGMNGDLAVEICNADLVCCNAGTLDTSRDDFNSGNVDVFSGDTLGECEGADIGDGGAIMIVTHNGGDAWLGEWIRVILDGGNTFSVLLKISWMIFSQ